MTKFLPIITTLTGSSLLSEDWERIGVESLSLYLDSLLVKPGMMLLRQLSHLGIYVGWDKEIILNASRLKKSSSDTYRVRSAFDGSFSTHTEEEVFEVIRQLQPTYLVAPSEKWAEAFSSTAIRVIVPESERKQETLGAWRRADQETMLLMHDTSSWEESEKPISLAVNGCVYTEDGTLLDLKGPAMAHVFQPLSTSCPCEACETKLTVAYFHHLLTQTPGLCQRFLIQHNVANYPTIKA